MVNGTIVLTVIGLITVGFITLGQRFIGLWLGPDYSSVYYCTVFLIIPGIFYVPQQIANTAVVVLNKVKSQGIVFVIAAVINIVLSVILGYFWGEIGCAVSICIVYLIRTLLMNRVFHQQLNINVVKFFKDCHLKMAPALLLALGIGFLISNYLVIASGWITFFIQVACLCLSYVIIMWLIGWNKYEKNLFLSMFRSVLKFGKKSVSSPKN